MTRKSTCGRRRSCASWKRRRWRNRRPSRAIPCAQVEAGDVRLVDVPRGLEQGLYPRGELAGRVAERPVLDLSRGGREGASLYRAGVHVQPYVDGSIVHREAPSMNAAWPPAVWTPLLSA